VSIWNECGVIFTG